MLAVEIVVELYDILSKYLLYLFDKQVDCSFKMLLAAYLL